MTSNRSGVSLKGRFHIDNVVGGFLSEDILSNTIESTMKFTVGHFENMSLLMHVTCWRPCCTAYSKA